MYSHIIGKNVRFNTDIKKYYELEPTNDNYINIANERCFASNER